MGRNRERPGWGRYALEAMTEELAQANQEAANERYALGEATAEMGVLREALAAERAGREAAEYRTDQMSARVVAELVAMRELVEGGARGGRRRT